MTTFVGAQSARPKQASNDCGNIFHDHNTIDVTAALTTSDEVVLGIVPAGVELTTFQYRSGDLDTGTALTLNIGYRSLHPDQKETANATFFASASAAFQAAQASWVDLVFNTKLFKEPVAIVAKPAVSASGQSGTQTINTRFTGVIRGVI